jgi:hypothetical protein
MQSTAATPGNAQAIAQESKCLLGKFTQGEAQ